MNAPSQSEPILFYEREFYMFSNFSAFAVDWRGLVWMTAEHAYQSAKFNDWGEVQRKIYSARSAHDAKAIARDPAHAPFKRADWSEEIKLGIMEDVLRAKLAQHAIVREKLIKAGEREIVENSPVDYFWGRGSDGTGRNHQGKIWMKLGGELRARRIVEFNGLD